MNNKMMGKKKKNYTINIIQRQNQKKINKFERILK